LRELALHILDIAENGITAGADRIEITVDEARSQDRLTIVIRDNGHGMSPEKMRHVTDPFVTTRTSRRVGLGLPLFAAAATRCDGDLQVRSEPGKGTEVTATFRFHHIDRAPLGDVAATIMTLILGNPHIDVIYSHSVDDKSLELDTRDIRRELGDIDLNDPIVMRTITESIRSSLNQLTAGR
jgi:anti-sigma regulatory factor (Ser/Thr protein kinase)